ncbi:MAG: class I poly(R)-hydroxyalkanoic acid synthase [Rhodocyclaceae bacterium]|jgi:polyhydroxyalkanoate synthase|uniref:Class I poly(R)-hydroxyalkanoic acid synthase n=1 Tax=Candidatus Desulfobacillus denitrificans TaxID=2608985 RepID=A0A809R2M7_9PROT|nr:class I poly(R)-hydroxyalkanoic acid synthase [Candidatus Desulfobacillus denitrificans]GIK45244.1 MAG: class I poly(R)-hydroxyalkanoic acid synthase [Betaproteobacteria bacterium]GJQ53676.1 MAG: class I poly(R)-hydroxyalkanoic acid synthase [Rhodocyclaceae bacterium]
MSGNPQPDAAAMQNLFQAGQAFAQGVMNFLAQPSAARSPQAALGAQFAQNEAIASLQKEFAARHAALWQGMLRRGQGGATAEVKDKRFAAPEWSGSPFFDYLRQAYLLNADYIGRLIEALPMDDEAARSRLQFFTRQFVDAMAPSNFVATNPEFIRTALDTQGASITAGIRNLLDDLGKGRISMTDEAAFEVGRNLAVTPGQVIFENALIQLIQYDPETPKVHARPLVIVPPCINKFYILDLQPENSFVRHAVEQGMTVFLVSWRNPQAELGHLGWDDYLEQGALAALDAAQEISGADKLNALGFCVGGTILAAALCVAKARGEDRVASLTLLTSLLDFSDGGEVTHYVDAASVKARETAIGQGGLLRGAELASAFSSLRANDLIWQYVVGNYLKGGKPPAFDLLYWNADSTNLPGPFAVWYLRHLYLENALREPGRLAMCGTTADLGRLDMPAYIYSSREDHIVPWKSAYLSRGLLGGETTFVMGASGHIAGVVNPPAKGKRSHWRNDAAAASAENWLAGATEHKGSWWPHWIEWLRRHAGEERAAPKKPGSRRYKPIEAAPGRYVKEKA